MKNFAFVLLTLFTFAACSPAAPEEAVEEETTTEDVPAAEVKTFEDEKYGVSFEYPMDWIFADARNEKEGIFQVQVSNMEAGDGPTCKEGEAHFVVWGGVNVNTGEEPVDFKTYFESRYVEGAEVGDLGQYYGEYEETVLLGYDAYKLENVPFESGCDTRGYLVDYSENVPGLFLHVVMLSNEGDAEAEAALEEIFGTLKMSGYKK